MVVPGSDVCLRVERQGGFLPWEPSGGVTQSSSLWGQWASCLFFLVLVLLSMMDPDIAGFSKDRSRARVRDLLRTQ